MAVSIVIKRSVKDRNTLRHLGPLITQLRSMAASQTGFITGQTYSCLDCEGEYLVISTWNTLDDWKRWMHSEARRDIQRKVDELLGEKTVYRYYEPVTNGIFPGFQDSVHASGEIPVY